MTHKLSRKSFFKTVAAGTAATFFAGGKAKAALPLNVLLITADDMNYNSVGVYGCGIANITPHIDQLAAEGVRFTNAHVTIAVCQPSRSVLMTGRYPHRNGAEGFEAIDDNIVTLQERLNAVGYLNGILSKTGHLDPKEKFYWDFFIQSAALGKGRDPALYYSQAKTFFENAKSEGKPFFLMANSQDPHRPFAGSQQELNKWGTTLPFSRQITLNEAEVPGFLPELPDVRQEISEYFTSVHRCDETVGEVLRALKDTGFEDNTLVMFLSDNGMALPFAKTNCYLNSTKTPWIAKWPGVVAPGSTDTTNFISGIDFMPTILEAVGLSQEPGMDGRSFMPLLNGAKQNGRDKVFTVFHMTSAKRRYEMRCVQDKKFGYIFNGWADGTTVFKNESQNGLTMKAMNAAAATDPDIAARVELFLYRVPEEFYDFEADPDALNNLIDDPGHQAKIDSMRRRLMTWMAQTNDFVMPDFQEKVGLAVPLPGMSSMKIPSFN